MKVKLWLWAAFKEFSINVKEQFYINMIAAEINLTPAAVQAAWMNILCMNILKYYVYWDMLGLMHILGSCV